MSRLAFVGTPPAAATCLRALVEAGHDVALVVTRPDRRRGRGSGLVPSAVKQAAAEAGLAVTDRLEEVTGVGAELGVVVAYGRIIPAPLLDALAMVNVHFSLLPRWRGAAPVERAILAGDAETGVDLMWVEAGLDTGPVLAEARTAIDPEEGAAALTDRLAQLGARLLTDALADGVAGLGPGRPQVGEPTYAAKIDPGELRLDFTRPAEELARVVRLGRAWTTFRGARLLVLGARPTGVRGPAPGVVEGTVVGTATGGLELREVQPEGRRPQPAGEWGRGARLRPGERLGEPSAPAGR